MAIYASWLVDAARMATAGTGKQVIVSPGWQSRGHGGLRVLEVVVGHHTATPEAAPGDYPSLNVVQNGRAGLAGPLAQLGLGRSGNVYVIAAGLSYHAGASRFAGYLDLNDEAIGIEAEDSGDGHWTNDELFMYPRLVGACLHYMRRDTGRYASHRTVAVPAGRKPDPTGISDDWMRQQAAAFLQGGGTDMGGEIADRLVTDIQGRITNTGKAAYDYVFVDRAIDIIATRATAGRLEAKLDALAGNLSNDEANIVAAIREIPTPEPVTPEQLDQLRAGLVAGLPQDLVDTFVDGLRDRLIKTSDDTEVGTGP